MSSPVVPGRDEPNAPASPQTATTPARRVAAPQGPLLFIGLVLAVLALGWLALGFLTFPSGEGWGYDYRAYLDAAVRLQDTGSLYQAETLSGPYQPGPYGLYLYAPPLGVATGALTSLPVDSGTALWFFVHVVALALACAVMPVRAPLRLVAFGVAAFSYAVTRDLVLGNVSVLLLPPMALAWRWLDQPLGSIAQAVAISVRPTLGILLAWQLLRHQWRAVAWTIAAGLALIALTLPVVGVGGYVDYLIVLGNLSDVTGVERNYDLASTALRLGADQAAATVALLAGYAIAIGAILLSLRRDREVGFMVTLTASLLLSPLLWDHYLAMLLLPAAFLAQRGRPWALALPLLSWLPAETYPFTVLLTLGLVFLARDAETPDEATPTAAAQPVAAGQAPA